MVDETNRNSLEAVVEEGEGVGGQKVVVSVKRVEGSDRGATGELLGSCWGADSAIGVGVR